MFTNDSRWDRHLPNQSYEEEKIEVGAIFKKGGIVPKWFIWRNRRYMIREITFHWTDKRGDDILHYYSVTDGINVYLIYFNNKHLHWRLDRVAESVNV